LLLEATHRDLGFDGAALLFFDDAGERLAWRGTVRADDTVSRCLRQIELSVSTAPEFIEAIQNGEFQTLRIGDDENLERPVRTWATEVSAEEILVVPLVGKHEVIGVLAVDNRSGGRRLGADDRTLLDGLSMQAVIAIENARLVEDLRSSRAQVVRADRLGTLGTLAAGLAHEINNPLVSIHTFLSLAPEKRGEDDPAFWHEYHKLASSELDRIRGLVATMSRLGRGGSDSPDVERGLLDLSVLVEEVARLMEPEVAAAGVELELERAESTPKVLGVRDHLHQVFLNLLLNALHATPQGGRVKLRVEPHPDRPQTAAYVSIEDSGCGIREEDIERIFDPFFTTKDPDSGTGLGLMISHQIVTDHGGSIEVRSRPDEGTTFCVTLPVNVPGGLSSEAG